MRLDGLCVRISSSVTKTLLLPRGTQRPHAVLRLADVWIFQSSDWSHGSSQRKPPRRQTHSSIHFFANPVEPVTTQHRVGFEIIEHLSPPGERPIGILDPGPQAFLRRGDNIRAAIHGEMVRPPTSVYRRLNVGSREMILSAAIGSNEVESDIGHQPFR